jgi:hypothetical protein
MKFTIADAKQYLKLRFLRKKSKKSQKHDDPTRQIGRFRLSCNLCSRVFRSTSRHLRFCRTCRIEDEAFRFAEWL